MSGSLTIVNEVLVPQRVVDATQTHLRAAGRRGLEGMALWAGRQDGACFEVTDAVIPRQQGHRTDHGLAVSVPGVELHRINMLLHRAGLRLVAQVHSHPTEAFHSDTDDRYAIATALGCLSLVVPDFAVRPFALHDCAAYRLTRRRWWRFSSAPYWRRLHLPELSRTLKITS